MNVKEKILDAIQLLAENSVAKAEYDKTIQAQIISCEDATIGKYRCRYQDSTFYAYSSNSDLSFSKNSYVYVLVPGNDFKKEKTILGTTEKLGINYISQAEGEQAYDIIGTNCVSSSGTYYLNTNNKNYKYTIYQNGGAVDNVVLDVTALQQYIRASSSLIAGATFKTNIPDVRQSRGHYGLIYNLAFYDNGASDQEHTQVIRSYIVNEDNMIGNPYNLVFPTRQYQIFDIDGENFIRVDSIAIFNSDFPGASSNTSTGRLNSGDIQITNLELTGAMKLSESDLNGVIISFYTPQGTFFTDYSTAADSKKIVAQVRVKGKLVSSAQKLPFYWGSEDVSVTPSSQFYNKKLGRGWKCLNPSNKIVDATGTQDPVVEWTPMGDTWIVQYETAISKDNRYKVAVVYDDTVITKQINIQNLAAAAFNIQIVSSDGTKFYYDIGHPTLTCLVNDAELVTNQYSYYWAYESDTGVLVELPETTSDNTTYTTASTQLNNLQTALNNGTKFANAEKDNLTNLQTQVESFKFIQRVQKNKVYDVQIKNITNRGVFKCSVYRTTGSGTSAVTTYLGTGAITLTNSLDGEDLYSLVINNGSETFQYNESGVSPTSSEMYVPQEIEGLSFTVYDNLGNAIDANTIVHSRDCSIKWYFPIEDTMLVDPGTNGTSVPGPTGQYKIFENATNLVYDIAKTYDIKKKKNQIKLNVDYKGMNLTAETDFTFVKQGEPGTNGTEFIVKLIPNTRMDDPPLWPIITRAGSKYFINYGINTQASEQEIGIGSGNAYQFFKAQLWHSGELVWEGFESTDPVLDSTIQVSAVHWDILSNKYTNSISDASAFGISTADRGFIYYTSDHLNSAYTTPLANIIKCTIILSDQKMYYGTIPVITAYTSNENYRVSLRDYTGYRYVIYSSDGMSPQYDNSHPFEFVCMEKINNVWEDVSTVAGSHKISYTPSACGNFVDQVTSGTAHYTNAELLQLQTQDYRRDGLQDNQWNYRPASRYDGQCVNEAVLCTYKQGSSTIGKINIPVHFLLNKYGLAHINEWDGNSVQINEEGGYILAPQMGAGYKDQNNNFTGVLMGQVKVAGKRQPDTGLLGYATGERTFFVNSLNGSAIFGKAGNGQIIIDPDGNKALLYSSAFWKNYNPETGLPSSYGSGNENKQGLLIDLTTPQIRFGNGNFSVNVNGYLTAKGGGSIAGWKISDWTLTAQNNSITLQSATNESSPTTSPGKIFSNSHSTLTTTSTGFYLAEDGLSIGSKFKVTNTGVVMIGDGAVTDLGPGTTPPNPRHWRISDTTYTPDATADNPNPTSLTATYIAYNASRFLQDVANPDTSTYIGSNSVYIGTNGISLGKYFSVDNYGNVKITRGSISIGTTNIRLPITYYNSTTGTDEPVYMADSTAEATGTAFNITVGGATKRVTFENTGEPCLDSASTTVPMFYVNTTGNQLRIYMADGDINLGRGKFTVNNQGFVKATAGKIGGFNISDDYMARGTRRFGLEYGSSGGSLYLGRDGITLGTGFSVDSRGNVQITRGSIGIGSHTDPDTGNTVPNFGVDTSGYLTAQEAKIAGVWMSNGQILGGTRSGGSTGVLTSGFVLSTTGAADFGPYDNRFRIWGETTSSPGTGTLEGINLTAGTIGFRIQPALGFGHFTNIDVTQNVGIGGSLKGLSGLSITGSGSPTENYIIDSSNGYFGTRGNVELVGAIKGRTQYSNLFSGTDTPTFWISSSNGQANFKKLYADKHGRINTYGGINGYSSESFTYGSTTPTFWIDASNGKARFSEVNTNAIVGLNSLEVGGNIDADGNINSDGALTGASLTISGGGTLNGTFNYTNSLTINATTIDATEVLQNHHPIVAVFGQG